MTPSKTEHELEELLRDFEASTSESQIWWDAVVGITDALPALLAERKRLREAWTGPDGESVTDIIRRYADQVAWPHSGYDPAVDIRAWADRLDSLLAEQEATDER